jgi:hypothetical protein
MNLLNKAPRSRIRLALRASLILIASAIGAACERDTKIEVGDANPPTFHLSGNGRLGWFEVIDLTPGQLSIYAPERTLWKIVPPGNNRVGQLPDITYGRVPPGFKQEFPLDDETPGPLAEEKPYQISALTSEADTGSMVFIIRGGKILPLDKAQDGHYYVRTPEGK